MSSPTTASLPRTIRLDDYAPPAFIAHAVELLFDLHEDHALVTSTVSYERNPRTARGGALVLDGEDLELVSMSLDGSEVGRADWNLDDRGLRLGDVPDRFVLELVTRIEPQDNSALQGLYRSGGTFCTQMEAEGFRRVTYFQDRPDVLSVYTTTIEADAERFPVLLANGNLVSTRAARGGRHAATWHDPFPKPCYLFALVAGDLARCEDTFTTRSGRTVDLHLYVDPGNEDRTAHAMASLKKAMRWDERTFGREYDLDLFMIVAVNDFNMGAMENKGLNIFNASLILASPQTATDDDYGRIEGVVGHEYFHNWSGNRVTCRDWFQLSLKEGLTVFRDQEFSSDMNSRAVQRIADVRHLRNTQFPEDAGPLAHPVRPREYIAIDNFYTRTVYEKGAEVIRMMQAILGREAFRKGTDLYFDRHDGQAVTTDDFVRAMEHVSGVDLGQFRRWYEQAGTPRLHASGRYDAAHRTFDLTVEQSCPPTPGQPSKPSFHVPLRLGLLDAEGRDLPLRLEGEPEAGPSTRVFHVQDARQTFRFVDVPAAPVPSLLRGFSAPVLLETEMEDDALLFLATRDSDLFNRWEAAQQLAMRCLLRQVDLRRRDRPLVLDPTLSAVMERTLAEADLDPAVAAEILLLPEESVLGDAMQTVDVDGIHAAREGILRALASAHREALLERYERLHAADGAGMDAGARSRRSLKNVCLAYLVQLGDEQALSLCGQQLASARTMTDELAALELLADAETPRREAALAAFRSRWQHEPLVVNKWFAAQALSKRPQTVEDVARLARDPLFDGGNPNNVRALYRSFSENVSCFHAADGRGYELLGQAVRDLDARNPIMAGRLASAFNVWRRYDRDRKTRMRAQIERFLASEDLSSNLYEVASKALA